MVGVVGGGGGRKVCRSIYYSSRRDLVGEWHTIQVTTVDCTPYLI